MSAIDDLIQALEALKQKPDGTILYAAEVHNLVDGIFAAMEMAGDVTVTTTPIEGGNKITITDPEGVAHEFDVMNGVDGAPGNNGHNPCLGVFADQTALETAHSTAEAGDYAYADVTDSTTQTTTSHIFRYSGSAWVDNGEGSPDNQTAFDGGAGPTVAGTKIDNTELNNPADNALPKAGDVMKLAAKLDGVTADVTKVALIPDTNYFDGKYVKNDKTIQTGSTPTGGVPNGILIVDVSNVKKIRFLGYERNVSTTAGYGFSAEPIDPTSTAEQLDYAIAFNGAAASARAVKIEVAVPEGMNYFACTIYKYGTPSDAVMTLEDFYCYLCTGESVGDSVTEINKKIEELGTKTNNSYEQPAISSIYSNYYVNGSDGSFVSSTTNDVIDISVVGVEKVRFTGVKTATQWFSGFAFYDKNGVFMQGNAWDYGADAVQLKEYVLNVPAGAASFKVTRNKSYFTVDDYFYYIIRTIGNDIEYVREKVGETLTVDDATYIVRRQRGDYTQGVAIDDANGTQLRIIFPVSGGEFLNICTENSDGYYIGVWNTLKRAVMTIVDSNLIEQITDSYTAAPIQHRISKGGYLSISLKHGSDVITDSLRDELVSKLHLTLSSGYEEDIKELSQGRVFLKYPLPQFSCGEASTSGYAGKVNENVTNRIVINDAVALPYSGVRLRVRVPNGFLMGMRFYNGSGNNGSAYPGVWMGDKYEIKVPKQFSHFMCYLCHTIDGETADNDYVFNPEQINGYASIGLISIEYEEPSGDIIARGLVNNEPLKATRVRYTSDKQYNTQGAMPSFVHCSDIHGDAVRWYNAVKFAEYFGLDGVIYTGDSCAYHVANGLSFIPYVIKDITPFVPVIATVGNHDTNGDASYVASLNTNLYNNVIKPFEVSGGYTLPSSSQYDDAPTYYYRDFAGKKLRVIVLNLYDTGVTEWEHNALTQKQIDWFIATLKSTPADYGVLVAYHRSVGGVIKDDNYVKFWQISSTAGYSPSTWSLNGVNGKPILDIIDAFISKTHLESSFIQTVLSGTQTITIDADFTSLNSGVEFIAHLFGHHHRDTVGYYDSTQKQLALCVCQGTAAYSSNYTSWATPSDLPRAGGGKEQDAFNVYTIDRAAKTVRIAKIGSTLSSETLQPRDFMVIPYAD
jgi:hypothetical protein